ncbi:MAG: 50S ribosomal protein L19 [Candidatus Omnitrophota bacterium]
MDKIKLVEAQFLKKDIPEFKVGDTLKLRVKIQEGDKARIHPYEGIVIERRGKGTAATFTVRKISFGEGVERTFPVHSPSIESMKVVKRGKVRQARLYYLRGRVGKAAKIKEIKE